MQKSGNRERIYCARPALLPKEGQNVKQIHITETVLRDAQQSLIATRMPLSDMLPILGIRQATTQLNAGAARH